MAGHRIFLKKTTGFEPVGSSISTKYHFDGETLTIKWKNQTKGFQGFKEGDMLYVECDGFLPTPSKIILPKSRAGKLAWLMDFPKYARTSSYEDIAGLENDIEFAISPYDFSYENMIVEKEGQYKIILSDRPDCGGVFHREIWINENISPEDIWEMLEDYATIRGLYFPSRYVKMFLNTHFNIDRTLQEIEKIIY